MHMQSVESPPPAAAVFVSAMMHMQQKITELADQLEANQTDNLAMAQLLRERSQKPAANEELWGKVAGALGLTNSAWGMLCVCPRGGDRNLISITLTYAFIGDCFLTRQALHDLFSTLEKPTEEEVYATALPIIYSTVDEAWRDLYVLTDAQFDHARTRPFVSGRENDETKLKHLLAFIKQSQGLSDPPHVRVERSGTRTDIALESIGTFFFVFFVVDLCLTLLQLLGKRTGPNVLGLWSSYLGFVMPGHFRMDNGNFVSISAGDLETYQNVSLPESRPPVDDRFSRAFAPVYEAARPNFGAFAGSQSSASFSSRYPYPVEDPMNYPRPSTVQVSEVGPAQTSYEKFIQLESEDKHAALRDFYPGVLCALNEKEFKTLLRKFNANSVKRARESTQEAERPVTRSQKSKSASKKGRKSKKPKKGPEPDVLEDEPEEEEEE